MTENVNYSQHFIFKQEDAEEIIKLLFKIVAIKRFMYPTYWQLSHHIYVKGCDGKEKPKSKNLSVVETF